MGTKAKDLLTRLQTEERSPSGNKRSINQPRQTEDDSSSSAAPEQGHTDGVRNEQQAEPSGKDALSGLGEEERDTSSNREDSKGMERVVKNPFSDYKDSLAYAEPEGVNRRIVDERERPTPHQVLANQTDDGEDETRAIGWKERSYPDPNILDPYGAKQHDPGAKNDKGKADLSLLVLFGKALSEVGAVGTMGAEKYTRGGWQFVPDGFERYTAAMLRHVFEENYSPMDDESGLLHAAHAAWNALARLELLLREQANGK